MKIIEKPWGREEVLEKNERYMMKKLTMWKGHRCSLQYHKYKQETIYILSGKMNIKKMIEDFGNCSGLTYLAGMITLLIGMLLIEYQ